MSEIGKISCPVLYAVGSLDPVKWVPFSGKHLMVALRARGGPAEYKEIPGLGHGDGSRQINPPERMAEMARVAIEFLTRHLSPSR